MSEEFAARVAGIGALAEPARRELYAYVVAQPEPVSREQAAEGVGLPLHSVKFHLDRLVDEGLLEVEFRRLSGRRGPGAGRPSKLYRRSSEPISVSLPERRYDLAGGILAAGVERASRDGGPVTDAVRAAAAEQGLAAGRNAEATGSETERTVTVLAGQGYEPRLRDDDVLLANCPFDALARDHTELVCGLNEAYVGGVLAGLGCAGLEAHLEPEPGLCCVKARPRPR
ncbi:MAG: helix-turn-helix transcriptional regulator [Nocardioides sp.]